MPREAAPVAKSLHTVTVLVQVATYVRRNTRASDPEAALERAMVLLGLEGRPDPHGLRDRALAALTKES